MNPLLATIIYSIGILALFYLDRDEKVRTSKALWVPILWLLVNGSRPVSLWFQTGPTLADQYAAGSPVDAAVYGAITLAGILVLSRRASQVLKFVRTNPALIAFILYCLVSTMWADDPFVALKRWIKSVGDVVMILIVLTDPNQKAAIKRFLTRAAYILLPVSVLFIKYYPDWGRSYNPWTWTPMYSGVTTFKNLLGMITLVGALGTLWCFQRSWRELMGKRRWQHLTAEGLILLIAIWLLITADSMTSLSCLILAGSVMLVAGTSWAARRRWVIHTSVAAVIGLTAVALFFDTSGGMVKQLGRNSTLTGRTAIWDEVIILTRQAPIFGAGFESFWQGDRLQAVWRVEKGIQEAHNGYLEVYANLGWVGIALLALLIVTGYRGVLSDYSRDRMLGVVKLGFFVTALVYSFTEAGFRMMSPVWLGFLLAIISVPVRREQTQTISNPVKKKAWAQKRHPAYASTFQAELRDTAKL